MKLAFVFPDPVPASMDTSILALAGYRCVASGEVNNDGTRTRLIHEAARCRASREYSKTPPATRASACDHRAAQHRPAKLRGTHTGMEDSSHAKADGGPRPDAP